MIIHHSPLLPLDKNFNDCINRSNEITPTKSMRTRVKRILNSKLFNYSVTPECPIFKNRWNNTLYSLDESSLDDFRAIAINL